MQQPGGELHVLEAARDLARRVRASGFPHPVTASHCVSLSMQSESDQQRIAEAVAEAGVSIVALPQTNLFLQGRDHQQAMPRGLTAVRALSRAGVNVCAGADNLQDPFNPIGRGDPLETAGLMIAVGHLLPDEAWSAVTSAARLALLGQRASIAPGQPADLIALPVATVREAIAFTPGQRIVFRNGHRLSP
ncbi:MAG TPA: amidohydrolase family protein [Ilumatobacteraceae bacterium]|nr:amidohydrolase family protein [Ilumatobacteraceae bacterium]